MGKMGRPIKYVAEEIWPNILEQISNGRSLRGVLREPGMPSYVQAWRMVQADEKLKEAYQKAVEDRADLLVEQIIELADEPIPEHLEGVAVSAWVNQRRLQVDARKWVASKMKPRTYGDRIDVSVSDQRISVIQALEQAQARVQIGMTKTDDITDVEPK